MLGPLLFVVFMNHLSDVVSSSIKMFADDARIYRSVSQASDICLFQSDLDALVDW